MKLTAPVRPSLSTVRDDLDRFFDHFAKTGFFGAPSRILETMWSPSLDFSETEKEYIARVEVPGIPKDDLEVNVEGRMLTVTGRRSFEKEEKTEDYFWREREQGRFVRTVQLPSNVDATKVVASCEDGIMTIRLPKSEPAGTKRIPVR